MPPIDRTCSSCHLRKPSVLSDLLLCTVATHFKRMNKFFEIFIRCFTVLKIFYWLIIYFVSQLPRHIERQCIKCYNCFFNWGKKKLHI